MSMDLVMGMAFGYAPIKLIPFASTLRSSGYTGCIVLFVVNNISAWSSFSRKYEVSIVETDKQVENINKHPSIFRYYLYLAYLREHQQQFSRVLISDTRDVVFQSNPFRESWPNGMHCFYESNEATIGTEVFTRSWVQYLYGDQVLADMHDLPVSCSGVSLGALSSVISYLETITRILDDTFVDLSQHGLDQGAHNYLIHNRMSPNIHMHNDCSWLVATISGFREVSAIHFDKTRNVLNPASLKPVPILHQYDRVPSLLWRWNRREYFARRFLRIKQSIRFFAPRFYKLFSRLG